MSERLRQKFTIARDKIRGANEVSEFMESVGDLSQPSINRLTQRMRESMCAVNALEQLANSGKFETRTRE